MSDLATRLRTACDQVRVKSYPLSDLIPLMQQAADALAAAPAQPVAEPLKVFSKGPWTFRETGQDFSGADLDEAAFVAYREHASHGQAPATQQPEGDVVAYLDVGANGYLDLGSELSEDALQQLPKGRHALVIAGTYGIDGYVAAPQPSPTAQAAESVPAIQGEMNVQLDIDSNHSAPGQQRDVARSVALGQPMGNGQDQAAGRPSAQGDKLLTVAERNIRSFLRSATFKSESDREAALNCVDVLWEAARAPADSQPAVAGEPDFYTACAWYEGGGVGEWIALPGYSNETEHGVKHLVLEAARNEGYKGTAAGRLLELGWEIRPVFLTPQPTQTQAVAEPLTPDQIAEIADATHTLRASHGQAPAGAGMGHTDGGRNMFYEGRFDGESRREQQARLRWANDMRAAFERHTGNGWFDKDWRTETGLWSSAWHACLAAQPTTTAQTDSVQEDAARYRHLRDSPIANNVALAEHFGGSRLQDFDAAIDAARKQGANHD